MTVPEAKPRLLSLTISHYCEKARWAMERYGIEYVEEPHAPGFHYSPVSKAGGTGTVPCLKIPDGTWLVDSMPILHWVESHVASRTPAPPPLFPEGEAEVARLCELFDSKLGPSSRTWAYSHVLNLPQTKTALLTEQVPFLEGMVFNCGGWIAVKSIMAKEMKINPETGRLAYATIKEVFAEVEEIMKDGRRYLVGDTFTAADLTFAALGAPVIGQPYSSSKGLHDKTPEEMRKEMEELRATPTGKFLLRLWAEERSLVLK